MCKVKGPNLAEELLVKLIMNKTQYEISPFLNYY